MLPALIEQTADALASPDRDQGRKQCFRSTWIEGVERADKRLDLILGLLLVCALSSCVECLVAAEAP